MRLWTLKPVIVLKEVEENGKFVCEPSQIPDFSSDFRKAYSWLVTQMEERIGPKPSNVSFPIWAWHTIEGERKPATLTDFACELPPDEEWVCLELEVPDEHVVLTDIGSWQEVMWGDYSNAEKVFDISTSSWVQATFWELKKEYILGVEFSKSHGA